MPPRPNIVIISCHDLGQHLGCYGVQTVHTPAIDGLAAEGIRFANSFCVAPQCSPSRAAIYTGRFPHSNGVMGLTHAQFAWDLREGERHLAGLLQEAGYHTALMGIQHETRRPEKVGFTELQPLHVPCQEVAERAVQFLDSATAGSRPFYLQVGFFEPHRRFDFGGVEPDAEKGITVPSYLVDDPAAREEFAGFQGAIGAVDEATGRILRRLEESGLAANTITIFTADHGIPFPRAKCSLYDPGLQVPFIVRWPERGWTGGRIQSEMIANVDYLPTLLEAIDLPVPGNVQGQSFATLLDEGTGAVRTEIFAEMTYHDYYDPRRCIRTEDHKLIANFSSAPFFMDPSQTWRPATVTVDPPEPRYAYHPDLELYDLAEDPGETENLAGQAAHEAVERDLARRLHRWMVETGDPLLEGVPPSPQHLRAVAALEAWAAEGSGQG